ncbi:MAG TPA: BON domain-containing protein [Rudaea sp.]|nr:BON domain-containing protein [Rudaea sp.]
MTDSQLWIAVVAELYGEPTLNAALVNVDVEGGVVTLSGDMPDTEQCRQAEKAARRVAGTRTIVTSLRIDARHAERPTDETIARAAYAALGPYAGTVRLAVRGGFVTVFGTVARTDLIAPMLAQIAALPGVFGVVDQLRAAPAVS